MKQKLIDAELGQRVKVIGIEGGVGLRTRLNNLGIYPGVILKKLTKSGTRGPIVVKVGGSQVALGYGMASKIIVETI